MNTLAPTIEPWLRGTHAEVPAVGRAVLHALDLALEDLNKWTAGVTDAEAHAQPLGLPSIAFHLKHIARSVDRILTYAEGNPLSGEQLAALKAEQSGEETLADLLAEVEASFHNAANRVRTLATAYFDTFRGVGRKQLPTSIGGALVHVADHTQRHVGQVVTTAKVLRDRQREEALAKMRELRFTLPSDYKQPLAVP
ncbi:MAG: DinB family protein [Terracidiphilus sp.]